MATVAAMPAAVAPAVGADRLAATATSARKATGTKLRFSSVAFYIGKGIKHTRHRKHGKKKITVITYSPNAKVRHVPATVELSVAGLTPGTHTLRVTFSYKKTVRKHGHKKTLAVTRTLSVSFSVC